MTRREKLEKIIIGTLLESNEVRNYFDDCRCISQDMFQDDLNRRIFGLIADMNRRGKIETTPCDILQEYGEAVVDIAADMCDLCTDYSFIHLKMDYNERHYLASCAFGVEYTKTDVQFEDYVKQFINVVYDKDEQRAGGDRTENAAA